MLVRSHRVVVGRYVGQAHRSGSSFTSAAPRWTIAAPLSNASVAISSDSTRVASSDASRLSLSAAAPVPSSTLYACRQCRDYATAATTGNKRPARRTATTTTATPKPAKAVKAAKAATSGRTKARKTEASKVQSKAKPRRKTTAKRKKTVKPVAKAKPKGKRKGRPRKPLTEEQQKRKRLRELQRAALKPPVKFPATAWKVVFTEAIRDKKSDGVSGVRGSVTAPPAVRKAAEKYRNLSPAELEVSDAPNPFLFFFRLCSSSSSSSYTRPSPLPTWCVVRSVPPTVMGSWLSRVR